MAVVAWTMTPRSANFSVINSTKFEEAVNVVWAQLEMCGMDFDATMFYLGQVVTKKTLVMQSVRIAKTGSQLVRPKVVVYMRKIACKKDSKAALNSMTKEQQMQVQKLHE